MLLHRGAPFWVSDMECTSTHRARLALKAATEALDAVKARGVYIAWDDLIEENLRQTIAHVVLGAMDEWAEEWA